MSLKRERSPKEAIKAIDRRADRIRERELERARRELDAETTLTTRQQAILRELSERLTDGLVSVPTAAIAEADEIRPETIEAALTLFGSDERPVADRSPK